VAAGLRKRLWGGGAQPLASQSVGSPRVYRKCTALEKPVRLGGCMKVAWECMETKRKGSAKGGVKVGQE
jgi:hypothetical protein